MTTGTSTPTPNTTPTANSTLTEPATSTPTRTALALAALLAALPSAAQERPREEELFGTPAQQEPPAPRPEQQRPGEAELFGKPEQAAPARPAADAEARVRQRLGETEDPLKLGGLLYWRASATATESGRPERWLLTAPALIDLYLDARPNDRVRGFVLGRTFYDPTIASGWRPFEIRGDVPPGLFAPPANPRAVLDQLWLRFDLGRVAFVTAGKQHVKWGVGRFWNPGDFLHPVRRDPLAQFDDRAGLTMVKVHVPWEARGWNFYAVGAVERLARNPDREAPVPNALGALGGGGRAELVLGPAELGLSAVAQRGMKPRLAADLSAGIWELDVKAEVAWRGSPDQARLDPDTGARQPSRAYAAAVLGAEWSHKYSDEDTFTIGAEYFHNQAGYDDDARTLPALIANGLFTPYYIGRHYAGAYLALPRPGSWNLHSFTLSAIANLSDRTGVVRIDWSYTLLTHMTLEAFAQGNLGKKGGEFRLAFSGPGFSVPPPVAAAGLALRLAL